MDYNSVRVRELKEEVKVIYNELGSRVWDEIKSLPLDKLEQCVEWLYEHNENKHVTVGIVARTSL